MHLPTSHTDPGGLAALVSGLIIAALVAIDPSGVLEGRLAPLVGAAVPWICIWLARSKAFAPATHNRRIAATAARARVETLRGHTAHGADSPLPGEIVRRPPPVVGPGHEGPPA